MTVELTTTNNAFRYPTAANNGTNFGAGIADLASDVDAKWSSGTLVARPAAGTRNRLYYATDTGLFYLDTGAAWVQVTTFGQSPLKVTSQATNYTAASGDLVLASGTTTITLPAPSTANRTVEVYSGSTALTVSTPSGGIFGLGLSGAASFPLSQNGATVVLQSDGTNWYIISGQQDSGWKTMSMSNATATGAPWYLPQIRVIGDRAFLRGAASQTGAGTVTFTLPSGSVPASQASMPAMDFTSNLMEAITALTNGNMTVLASAGHTIVLDGLSYSII